MTSLIVKEFQHRFQSAPSAIFFCPGRVNLIGEHIDYNGGLVMPCAISRGTWLAISKNTSKLLRFHCLNFPEIAELHLQSSYTRSGKAWFNYPLAIINGFLEDGHTMSGLDMLFSGDLPIGAGLSSSASIEVLTGFALSEIFGSDISRKDIALLSKKAENEFIGVNCGIMDQFAVAMGRRHHAILLNCDTLDHEYLPFETGDHELVIINSNKERSLADSKYNERFAECGAALKLLKQEVNVENLCEVTPGVFNSCRYLINDVVLEKRARHVITEQARVIAAVDSLKKGDILAFGTLMYESHQSLKELYEVSGKELDTIVEFCRHFPGCAGARMTGAGFGGCAIALVKKESLDDFRKNLSAFYFQHIGYSPEIFISEVGDGVKRVET